jgi:predicted DNA-binding transcriptional regulator YafY
VREPRATRDGIGKDGATATGRVRLATVLAHLLQHRSATRAALEAVTGATRRQIATDLRQLRRAGFVMEVGANRARAYAVHPQLLQRALPDTDRLALVVGHQVTRFLDGTPLHAEQSALADLEAKVRYVAEPSRTYGPKAEVVRTCLDAVLSSRRLKLRYDGPRGARDHDAFFPTNLLVYKRALYLVGRFSPTEEGRVYALAVDRVAEAAAGDAFTGAPFDVDAWLAGRFGITTERDQEEPEEVVLHFSADAALLVRERSFHPSQRLEEIRDGSVRLHLRVTGLELVPFVMAWGPKVVVEAPRWLRDRVREELAQALRRYPSTGTPDGT